MRRKASDFIKGCPGVAFKNGKLYSFESNRVVVMTPWPNPKSWVKTRKHGWRVDRKYADGILMNTMFPMSGRKRYPRPQVPFTLKNGQMLLPGHLWQEEWQATSDYRKQIALADYYDLIPNDVRMEILLYTSRRWHLLNLFARCPGALDLSYSNPALLYALASNWAFHKPAVARPIRSARTLMLKRQRDILKWLGFPPTESVRRILAKIRQPDISVECLLYLREAMKDPEAMKLLCFSRKLNRESLMSISDRRTRPCVTPRLVEEINGKSTINAYHTLKDSLRMAKLAGWEKGLGRFSSLSRLKEVHDDLSAQVEMLMLAKGRDLPREFDHPPFPGNSQIIPIRSPIDLIKEGREQHNCVGSYMFSVLKHVDYIYKVIYPVRATLSVTLDKGTWVPGQLYKACNHPVDDLTRRHIFTTLFSTQWRQEAQAV